MGALEEVVVEGQTSSREVIFHGFHHMSVKRQRPKRNAGSK